MSNVMWVLITVAVIGYVLAGRLAGEPVEARRRWCSWSGSRWSWSGWLSVWRRTRPLPDGRL